MKRDKCAISFKVLSAEEIRNPRRHQVEVEGYSAGPYFVHHGLNTNHQPTQKYWVISIRFCGYRLGQSFSTKRDALVIAEAMAKHTKTELLTIENIDNYKAAEAVLEAIARVKGDNTLSDFVRNHIYINHYYERWVKKALRI